MDTYLLGLRLGGRRVVVVGGGAVAPRRIPALLDAGADVVLVSPTVTVSLEDLATTGRIRWEKRSYADGDCVGAWLVCAWTDDAEVAGGVANDAHRAAERPARARAPGRGGDHRRRPGRSRADHRARSATAGRGRRGAHRPAGPSLAARRAARRCGDHRRQQDPL